MLEKYKSWLSGIFNCIRCEKEYRLLIFGFGSAICPDCYNGEKEIVFLDNSFWLNRLLTRISNVFPHPQHDKTITEDQDEIYIDDLIAVEENIILQ